MKVDNAMLVNVLSREEDAFPVLRRLLTDNHADPREQRRLARRALRLARSLLRSGILTRLDEPDEFGRRYVLTVDLPEDFALNQELAHFALAALDVLDPEAESYTLDVVSVIEAVLEPPAAGALGPAARGARRGDRGDEGRRHRVRRADGAARGGHLAAAAGRAARGDVRALPARATPGWTRRRWSRSRSCGRCGSRGWASPTSSAATSWPAPRGWCCATSPTPTGRSARPSPSAPHAGARRAGRVAGGDGPPDRLLAARRVGGAGRPRRTSAPTWPTTRRRRRRGRSPRRTGRSG